MSKKKVELRKIPVKNYVKAIILFLVVIIVVLYSRKLYLVNQENNLNQRILSRVIGEVKYNEFDNVFLEINGDYYIYVSYSNDEDILKLEKKLKNYIIDYELQNNFYYLNVTDLLVENNYLEKINNKLNTNNKIKELPVIVYYKDGKVVDILKGENKSFDTTLLKKFLDRSL